MSPETIISLAEDFDNIVAVKEAAGNMVQAMNLIQNKPENFHVISGDDALALPITRLGGSGVISVIGQGLPVDFSEMIRLALQGRVKEANDLHYKTLDLIGLIFEEGNPAGIKAALEILGISKNNLRLPLVKVNKSVYNKIKNLVENF